LVRTLSSAPLSFFAAALALRVFGAPAAFAVFRLGFFRGAVFFEVSGGAIEAGFVIK